ncbi:MAG: tRNA (N(6)-L-threonylcarbamoyladenosine(37)-C(2))-methylthiotransferase MtaB [Lachnospiraceae bacterium]|nr:tRNA (N(6)-L-threonylcarbamoyladenosine(37)-C(2))-methylthiotransferase MtaB [Lachnospiraceae bacterium]
MRVAFHNLGCKVNSYELDLIRQSFAKEGYREVPFEEKADIYVVNTCTVTNIADRKSRQMLHRARKENPAAIVCAIGCFVDNLGSADIDPAIDLAIDNRAKKDCVKHIEAYLRDRTETTGQRVIRGEKDVFSERPPLLTPGRTRADIKIQDGCNQFCSYCIIPYARGRIVSRDEEDTMREIVTLAESGIKEVVLVGIHVSSYGKDRGEEPQEALLRLLTRIQMIRGIERIRLSSIEPRIMTEEFVSGIAKLTKLCPHFHLSLQSGCDKTLKEMNRRYTTAEYRESVERLRRHFREPAITTDIIVGFPGETTEDFATTVSFVKEIGFYQIHVFPYSKREGTVAAKRKDQVPDAEKKARSKELLLLTAEQARAYREKFIGQEEEILLEETTEQDGKTFWVGHTMRYVEGIVREDKSLPQAAGMLIKGRFTGASGGRLLLQSDDPS